MNEHYKYIVFWLKHNFDMRTNMFSFHSNPKWMKVKILCQCRSDLQGDKLYENPWSEDEKMLELKQRMSEDMVEVAKQQVLIILI